MNSQVTKKTAISSACRYGYFETFRDHYSGEHSFSEYSCQECDMTFKKKEALRRHTLGVHKRNGYGVHYCRGCGKGFRYSSHARRHERYHLPSEERRSFVCAVCKKAFLSKQDLFRHKQIHSKNKKHQCSKCNYTGLRKFDVVLHERKHGIVHGKYVCITCGRYFLTDFRFQQHMKTFGHEGTEVQFVDMAGINMDDDVGDTQENNDAGLDDASTEEQTDQYQQFIVLPSDGLSENFMIKSEPFVDVDLA